VNTLYSSPGFLTFLATEDTELIPRKSDMMRELWTMAALERVIFHIINVDYLLQ
jgi:hypothetical protein